MITKKVEKEVFDTAALRRGFFIFGRHRSWLKGVNGLIAHVSENEILVQFLPDVKNVTNHYRILVTDISTGEWEIRISEDLTETEEVKLDEPDGTDP